MSVFLIKTQYLNQNVNPNIFYCSIIQFHKNIKFIKNIVKSLKSSHKFNIEKKNLISLKIKYKINVVNLKIDNRNKINLDKLIKLLN